MLTGAEQRHLAFSDKCVGWAAPTERDLRCLGMVKCANAERMSELLPPRQFIYALCSEQLPPHPFYPLI